MLSLPQARTGNAEGLSEDNPIKLSGTTKDEIQSLIQYLYFGYALFILVCIMSVIDKLSSTLIGRGHRMHEDFDISTHDWIHLLSISSRLLFDRIRDHAIKVLTSPSSGITPVDKALLALKYDIDEWLEPAYTAIILDKNTLSFEEIARLPGELSTLLLRSREIYHHGDNLLLPPMPFIDSGTSTSTMNDQLAVTRSTGAVSFGVYANESFKTLPHKRAAHWHAIWAEQLELFQKYHEAERAKHSND